MFSVRYAQKPERQLAAGSVLCELKAEAEETVEYIAQPDGGTHVDIKARFYLRKKEPMLQDAVEQRMNIMTARHVTGTWLLMHSVRLKELQCFVECSSNDFLFCICRC